MSDLFGIRDILTAIAGASLMLGVWWLYDGIIDDPNVARAARADFVSKAELAAETARADELQRQIGQGAIVTEEYRKRLAATQAEDAAEDARHEQETEAYEQKLKAAGRSCPLTRADIDFLLRQP